MAKKNARRGLSLKQLRVIELLAMKGYNKMTNQDIADEVGVNVQTIYAWKKDPSFVEELNRQVEFMNKAFLNEALSQLQKLITNGTVSDANRIKSIELFLKTQGLLKQTSDTKITIKEEEKTVDEILEELDLD